MKNINKKLSIGTSLITFIVGIIWTIRLIFFADKILTKDEAIAIVILLLGLNSVSIGSDLRGFIKLIKGNKDNDNNNN